MDGSPPLCDLYFCWRWSEQKLVGQENVSHSYITSFKHQLSSTVALRLTSFSVYLCKRKKHHAGNQTVGALGSILKICVVQKKALYVHPMTFVQMLLPTGC